MNKLCFVLLLLLSLTACKKTKLDGELSFLVGKWKWKHTLITVDHCNSSTVVPAILHSPTTTGYEYEVEFLKKGKILIRKSGERIERHRLILAKKNQNQNPTDTSFSFYFNKEGSPGFSIYYHKSGAKEYVYTNHLPLRLVNGFDGCKGLRSVFEKVE